jgi:hypothetical protein
MLNNTVTVLYHTLPKILATKPTNKYDKSYNSNEISGSHGGKYEDNSCCPDDGGSEHL